ncbi:Protein CASP [Taenia crassiceps]|uniref:Protein CASP n=1 Tax=Taenia crassiceps TaxID=6207 RepID=A0ABR4QS99_9CEST
MIASVQERDRLSRKKLVEVLLQFRNSVPEEVRKSAASVLKSFQTEVDRLTVRSQKAEDAFIQVYQRLAEMPDPSLALAEAESISKEAQRASDLKIENGRLRETIEELRGELDVIKSREKTEEEADTQAEELWREKEQKLLILLDDANARSSEAESKIKYLSEAVKEAESRAFALESDLEELKIARSKQVQTLLDELEKANEVIATLEEAQVADVSVGREGAGTHTFDAKETAALQNRIVELESELEAKTIEVDNLNSRMQALTMQLKTEVANLHESLESTNLALTSANESLASTRAELCGKSDYDEIKKELEVLRSIEFQQVDGDPVALMNEPLEFRLRRKNDQLQNKIASISLEKEQIESELTALKKTNTDMIEREAQQKVLIARLEEDLNRVSTWHYAQKQYQFNTASHADGGDEDKSTASEASILDIVQSQRDRLREQNRKLEENLLAMRQQVMKSQTEVESLRQDNVKLYEKIKFFQAYSPSTSSSLDRDDAVLARYSTAYEERLNPFRQFGQQERQRRYQALLPHEKIMHNLGRIIVSNRGARLATFGYVIVMHLLVFLVLYKMVTSTDPVCPPIHDPNDGRPN